MRVAFGDDPWVMSDAEIWFSTLWHFDSPDTWIDWTTKLQSNGQPYGPNPQNGIASVEAILQQADQTDKRIWLDLCFPFNDSEQWKRYGELIDRIKHHPSLYAVGICTDEWSKYPDTEEECKQLFSDIAAMIRSKGKLAFAHLFFAGKPKQGPMPDGVEWFIDNYDLVTLHNNYPHYDTSGVSNLEVMSGMLNCYVGSSLKGGTQGYFGAAGGDGQYRDGLPTQSDYWLSEDFINVIDDFENTVYPEQAQVLFLAIHYVDNQWHERSVLHSVMADYGDWLIEREVNILEISGSKLGCIVNGTSIEIPEKKVINTSATGEWTIDGFLVTVQTSPVEPDIEIKANGVVKGPTDVDGKISFIA